MLLPITRRKVAPVFENRFGILFNDEVIGPRGDPGRYLRWRWARPGIAVVPRRDGLVALSRMYRYPIGAESIEFPRGSVEPNETIEEAGARELAEETGLIAETYRLIGRLHPETGLLDSEVSIMEAWVTSQNDVSRTEPMESIAQEIVWKEIGEVWAAVRAGEIRCAITVASLALIT